MAEPPAINRRAHVRVRPDPRAPVEVQIMGDGFLDIVRARDVSAGGVSVYVGHNFDGCNIEAEVELVVKLPQQKPFVVRGVVRHRSTVGDRRTFGVEFRDMPPEKAAQIEAFVKQRVAEGGAV
jgi:c-di-GMP-binding flagellar brake protein YcgR